MIHTTTRQPIEIPSTQRERELAAWEALTTMHPSPQRTLFIASLLRVPDTRVQQIERAYYGLAAK